jgi:hypothetical protein
MERLERTLSPFDGSSGAAVIVTLPHNSLEYAAAAEEAGVSALVVGIEKTELAFPGLFAGFDAQEQVIQGILSTVSTPVGISIGEARPLSRETWERIMGRGFSFVNMYAHQMPLFVLNDSRINKFVSIGPGYMLEQVRAISEMEQVVALEAAIVSSQAKLYPFGLLDLSTLSLISKLTTKPVFLRTQKKVVPSDIPLILKSGVRGLTLDPSILEPGVEEYRHAVRGFVQWGARPDNESR